MLILLGALAFAGIGLLVASRARTVEAVSGLMNLVMLPMWVLSGIFFSSERFPEAMQPFIKALPLTPLINRAAGRLSGGGQPGVAGAGSGHPGGVGGGQLLAGPAGPLDLTTPAAGNPLMLSVGLCTRLSRLRPHATPCHGA